MLTVPLTLALLLQTPFPTGLVIPPAKPGGQPLEITVPDNPDACTKADLARLAERISALSARLDAVASTHTKACECTPPVAKPVVPPPKAPAQPTTYRLADLGGKTWTHTDPVWLRTYVDQLNAQRAKPRHFVPAAGPSYYGSPCAGGQCPR
jgi:hypothetical protein